MRIIFMGTPGFAVPSLDILYKAGFEIVAVITAPDRYGGRGRKELIQSEVKKYAIEHGLKVMQPTNLKSPKFNEELKSLKADLQFVVAFRMLPEIVWSMPPHGTYNLHGSLLPKYRGAAPINWAIINGDTVTGVTSFKLQHAIDTGFLYQQRQIPIYSFDTAGDLHDRMKWVAADLVLDTVYAIDNGNIDLKPQNETEVTHAPKLNRANTQLDLSQNSKALYDMIRGLSPFPTSWITIEDKQTKIYSANYRCESHTFAPGTFLTDNKQYLHVATSDGFLELLEVQMSGKKRMAIREFLNGYQLKDYKTRDQFN